MSAACFKVKTRQGCLYVNASLKGTDCPQKRIVDGIYEPGAALCTAVTGGSAIFQLGLHDK